MVRSLGDGAADPRAGSVVTLYDVARLAGVPERVTRRAAALLSDLVDRFLRVFVAHRHAAGNHAQAVAYHARRLGIPATIVMPVTTPFVKVKATEGFGATVILHGETLAEAQAEAEAIETQRNLVWVHPYDDPAIIAGQGTIALEMLEEIPDLEVLVVPIGGGGLIAGCAIAARAKRPSIEIVDNLYVQWETIGAPTLVANDFFAAGCVLGQPVPRAAARVPVAIVSRFSWPGSRRWPWRRLSPGPRTGPSPPIPLPADPRAG